MGKSTQIVGVVNPDSSTYKDMAAIRDACIRLEIPTPVHVEKYFNTLIKNVPYEVKNDLDCEVWAIKVVDIPTGVDEIYIKQCY